MNFAHWKTTASGALLAALQIIANGRDWKSIAIAVFTAILGIVAKDPGK